MADDHSSMSHLHKTLTWKDGFAIALVIPNGLFVTFGYLIGVIGAWTAIAIWAAATFVALLQNALFAELAAMFPGKSGGVARYAMEGWRAYFAPLGAIAAFGYWMGWSLAISVTAVALGSLIQAEWFPGATGTIHFLGHDLGWPHAIAIVTILAAWLINRFGVEISSRVNKVIGAFVLAGLAVVAFGPYVSGHAHWTAQNLTWHYDGGWKTLVVIFYVTSWTTYGTEICASFAPEYRDTPRDTSKALLSSGAFMLALFSLVPLGIAGSIGEGAIAKNPVGYLADAFGSVLGGASWLGVLVVVASLFIAMVSSTADGGRAIYGLAQEGVTIRQLDYLNKYGVPGRSLALDAFLNIAILLLLGTPVSILLASNFGYLIAITLGVSAFLLLRKDRPAWPRPIRRGKPWLFVAGACVALNLFVVTIGVLNPSLAGYGGHRQTFIGLGILLIGVLLYLYRQGIQDRQRIAWRMPHEPEVAEAPGSGPSATHV
jgi:amino acid transporter